MLLADRRTIAKGPLPSVSRIGVRGMHSAHIGLDTSPLPPNRPTTTHDRLTICILLACSRLLPTLLHQQNLFNDPPDAAGAVTSWSNRLGVSPNRHRLSLARDPPPTVPLRMEALTLWRQVPARRAAWVYLVNGVTGGWHFSGSLLVACGL